MWETKCEHLGHVEPLAEDAVTLEPAMTEMLPISSRIWDMKYRLKAADGTPVDGTIEDTWRRVARALASVEAEPARWEPAFYDALEGFKFLPAGRILAGAGAERQVTLFNCFVMGRIADDMTAIFEHLKEAALTMQQGGGIGYDFSTLRPKGAPVKGVGADASGPLPFMDCWDAMCRTIMSAGFRRGAMMGCLRCDHPDIEAFIEAKRDPGRLAHVQPLGSGNGRVHAGGEGQRAVGARLRRRRLPHRPGARAVGAHHPLDLRLCRARRDLHRPHQPGQQPRLLRGDLRHQSLR